MTASGHDSNKRETPQGKRPVLAESEEIESAGNRLGESNSAVDLVANGNEPSLSRRPRSQKESYHLS